MWPGMHSAGTFVNTVLTADWSGVAIISLWAEVIGFLEGYKAFADQHAGIGATGPASWSSVV